MPLSENEKNHIVDLALGRVGPETGMEKHFILVVTDAGNKACTPQEKEWCSYWSNYKNKLPKLKVEQGICPHEGNFSPTHMLRDGTRVVCTLDPNIWKDENGDDWEEENVESLFDQQNIVTILEPEPKAEPKAEIKAELKAGLSDSETFCIDCGSSIPQKRLDAVPNANRCVRCLESLEAHNPNKVTRRIDEGIGGTRDDNKKMRARNWGDMQNRGR